MGYSLKDVLDAREERWNTRQMMACSLKEGCLISVTLCVPLTFRNSSEYKEFFRKLCDKLIYFLASKGIVIKYEKTINGADGPAAFFSALSIPETVKRYCVMAEDSIPGARLLDVDITGNKGEVVGREQLGLPPRKCFLCSNPAHVCVFRRLHSLQDIALAIKRIYEEAVEEL